jgi:hypothetical protein
VQYRNLKAAAFVEKDDDGNDITEFYARLSTLIINQKFPDADEVLRQRMAESLARRRNQLVYRRRHQQKLYVYYPSHDLIFPDLSAFVSCGARTCLCS